VGTKLPQCWSGTASLCGPVVVWAQTLLCVCAWPSCPPSITSVSHITHTHNETPVSHSSICPARCPPAKSSFTLSHVCVQCCLLSYLLIMMFAKTSIPIIVAVIWLDLDLIKFLNLSIKLLACKPPCVVCVVMLSQTSMTFILLWNTKYIYIYIHTVYFF